MNVIIAYLETMFQAYPQTPRLLEAKTELQAMMEDAYNALRIEGHSENEAIGQVIRDFGNLDEVAPVLGIASDLEASAHASAPAAAGAAQTPSRLEAPLAEPVTMSEARGYAAAQEKIRYRVAVAVAIFVLSPIALIFLPGAAESGVLPISSVGAATFTGLMILFLGVAIGVVMIVTTARETAPYSRITERRFTPNPEVTHWAQQLANQHDSARIRSLQIAVILWILSPLPVIAAALLVEESAEKSFWVMLGVAFVLVFVAAGLLVILPNAWAHSVAETLRSGNRYAGAGAGSGAGSGAGAKTGSSADHEHDRSLVGVLASFYWPLLTAIYLAWSFIWNAWHISWMIWPIGAVFFGAVAGGVGALESYRRQR